MQCTGRGGDPQPSLFYNCKGMKYGEGARKKMWVWCLLNAVFYNISKTNIEMVVIQNINLIRIGV